MPVYIKTDVPKTNVSAILSKDKFTFTRLPRRRPGADTRIRGRFFLYVLAIASLFAKLPRPKGTPKILLVAQLKKTL